MHHLHFCNFTLWMSPALDARGRRPVRPPSARHCLAQPQRNQCELHLQLARSRNELQIKSSID